MNKSLSREFSELALRLNYVGNPFAYHNSIDNSFYVNENKVVNCKNRTS